MLQPTVELDVSQFVRPTIAEPESFSLPVDWKGMKKQHESNQMPIQQDGAGTMRSSMEKDAIENAKLRSSMEKAIEFFAWTAATWSLRSTN